MQLGRLMLHTVMIPGMYFLHHKLDFACFGQIMAFTTKYEFCVNTCLKYTQCMCVTSISRYALRLISIY